LALLIELALGLRVAAADLVQWYAQRQESLCVFPDTKIYWDLARTIRAGEPFEVSAWGDLPHFALRTPGYPLFLAGCQALFGERTLPVRLVQAVLGAISVWLVYRVTLRLAPGRPAGVALAAAALAAIDPYAVVTSALVLSEALFIPLMLVGLWALAELWIDGGEPRLSRWGVASAVAGASWGAAVLVRPSWALFVPGALACWVVFAGTGRRLSALKASAVIVLAAALVMAPWWIRNARVYGRFVPTALWTGASLYDGLNPLATGASDMEFLNDPDIWPLGEEDQDAVLRARAVQFAAGHPARAFQLAAIKFLRYWSPWPNADTARSWWVASASAVFTIPLFVLWLAGAYDRRGDARALVLLAGPLLYFCLLHMVFAGSMRYRIPGAVPAAGLAALGLQRVCTYWHRKRSPS
jgi:4-amino-4-deoxy-L-arabinose transferase-like glycosyltransferase